MKSSFISDSLVTLIIIIIIIDIAHTTRVQRERRIKDDRLKNRKTI